MREDLKYAPPYFCETHGREPQIATELNKPSTAFVTREATEEGKGTKRGCEKEEGFLRGRRLSYLRDCSETITYAAIFLSHLRSCGIVPRSRALISAACFLSTGSINTIRVRKTKAPLLGRVDH